MQYALALLSQEIFTIINEEIFTNEETEAQRDKVPYFKSGRGWA